MTEESYCDLRKIKVGIPQGSVLGPVPYLLYCRDILNVKHNTFETFTADTAILVVGKNHEDANKQLQTSID